MGFAKTISVNPDKKEHINTIVEWKKLVLSKYGNGGYAQRIMELIEEDLRKLKTR